MDWYEPEVRSIEAGIRSTAVSRYPIVFYGSSSIRLWTTLAQDLKMPEILNLAFGGSTLAACVHFFDRLVRPIAPKSIILYAGDNDLGDGRTPEEVASAFHSFVSKVDEMHRRTTLSFISVKPSPARRKIIDRVRRTNELIRTAIEKRNNGCFIDVFDAMLNSEGEPERKLYTEDGLHLSEAGYRLWTELLIPYRNCISAQRP